MAHSGFAAGGCKRRRSRGRQTAGRCRVARESGRAVRVAASRARDSGGNGDGEAFFPVRRHNMALSVARTHHLSVFSILMFPDCQICGLALIRISPHRRLLQSCCQLLSMASSAHLKLAGETLLLDRCGSAPALCKLLCCVVSSRPGPKVPATAAGGAGGDATTPGTHQRAVRSKHPTTNRRRNCASRPVAPTHPRCRCA